MRALTERLRVAVLFAVVTGAAGCTTAMELGRAETLRRGTWELGGALGASGYANEKEIPTKEATGGTFVLLPLLPVDVWGGYGITDRLEIDARLGTLAAQVGLKASLVRTPRFSLALTGGVSADAYGRFLDDGALRSRTALIAGLGLGNRFEVDLAPQASWPLDPARWKPELLGGTASVYYLPEPSGTRRIGLAVTWLHYVAPEPEPGDMRQAEYIGVALVSSGWAAGGGD